MTSRELAFYTSPPHPCGYLSARSAVTVFADPSAPMDMATYGRLIDYGFRRSGEHVYVPRCPNCQSCMPARLPVAEFHPDRAQRRTLRDNQRADGAVTAHILKPGFRQEHFELYRRYIATRHPGGGMDDPNPAKYLEFLTCDWCETLFVEFRLAEKLLAVTVLDVLPQGLSAVYTFFDPEQAHRSPGRYALLWSIGEAKRRGLAWVYLGYWIDGCRKMQYKQDYRPIELLMNGRWRRFDTGVTLSNIAPTASAPLDDNPV